MIVRPLKAEDDAVIRQLFDECFVLGSAIGFELAFADRYRSLCLDWFLDDGREHAAVAENERGDVVGYALVCTDADALERRSRPLIRRLTGRVLLAGLSGTLDQPSAAFYRKRGRDAYHLARTAGLRPFPALAHVNVSTAARDGRVAGALVAHVDAQCRGAGLSGWSGEVNAVTGRRSAALSRLGVEVIARRPNHTLTALSGLPIERLTIGRRLPDVALLDARPVRRRRFRLRLSRRALQP